MKTRHIALVVEDDQETAEDLGEILRSLDCDSNVVDNRDALTTLEARRFCLILLDLQIKGGPRRDQGSCGTRQESSTQHSIKVWRTQRKLLRAAGAHHKWFCAGG